MSLPLFFKFIAATFVSALALAGFIAPGAADASEGHVGILNSDSATTAPIPSSKALADGVKRGEGAPMGWERGGAGASAPAFSPRTQQAPLTSFTQTAATTTTATSGSPLYGIDVSNYQASVNWSSYATQGDRFAFIKATEGPYCDGSSYKSPTFSSQYSGATNAGLMRGAYHFAIPNCSGGATQADFFVHNGGGWTPDGKTLPGVLDIEYDPYTSQDRTNSCYGLTQSQMVAWIHAFSREYLADTGVYPIIYSTTGWWTACTGNSSSFASTNPFWIASYTGSTTSGPGSLPAGVGAWTFWQYGDGASPYNFCGTGYDCDQFNGAATQLNAIATTYSVDPHVASAWTSSMGYPTGKVSKVTAFGIVGYIQRFPNGLALVNSTYGTFPLSGAILSSWSPTRYGWPTTRVTAVTAQGVSGQQQRFAEGGVTNARAFVSSLNPSVLWVNGAILGRYDALGGTPAIGWPTAAMTSQIAFNVKGYVQQLQNGLALINSKYGTFASSGAILSSWSPAQYGWPTTDGTAVTAQGISGQQQRFAEGTVTSARAFVSNLSSGALWVNGAILARYDALGGTAVMGWPTAAMSSQTAFNLKGYIQRFQSGRALISSTYGVYTSNGSIYAAWRPSMRGWPTADLKSTVYRGQTGWIQTFGRGSTGPDFAFVVKSTGVLTWTNGAP